MDHTLMNWTGAQKDVIEARGSAILVSAAAGSGKTTVMTERVMRLITQDGIGLDRMLILTFTRAAATQMKQKIAGSLRERAAQDPADSFLRLQLMLLDRADISTIHTFCERLIRSYAEHLPIDPGFRIADESETKLIQDDVLDRVIEERLSMEEGDFALLMDFVGGAGGGERVSKLIRKVYSFAQTRPRPEEFLESCIGEGQDAWFPAFIQELRRRTLEEMDLIERAIETASSEGGPHKYLDGLRECLTIGESIMEADSYASLREAVMGARFSSLRPVTRSDGVDPQRKKIVQEMRGLFKDFVTALRDDCFSLSPELFSYASEGSKRINDEIVRSVLHFKKEYDRAKRRKGLLDFDDLEHFAYELMSDAALSSEIGSRYREIMIDEYQDTSLIQEEILRSLAQGASLFMVGDIKQSIYRFRNADPTIFAAKYLSFSPAPDADQRRIELNTNFRSRREVLSSVNDVFSLCMRKELGGVDYDLAASLHYGSDYGESGDTDFRTELTLYDPGQESSDINVTAPPPDPEECEYRLIGERIRELVSGQFMILGKDTLSPRPATYSDIAVLTRTRDSASGILDILDKMGIPARFETDRGYFFAGEVSLMLDFLTIIDNPFNDFPLMALMKSPFAGLTDDEIALMKAAYDEAADEMRPGDLYRALMKAALEGADPGAVALAALIQEYREKALLLPVHMLIGAIYSETGYYAYVAQLPDGEKKRKNLDMLLEKAESYASTSYEGVFDFLRYIEMLRKKGEDFGEALGAADGGNMVEIMTMHGAKGLEFPIVFLARAQRRWRLSAKESSVTVSALGLASDYMDQETRIRYPDLKNLFIEESEKAASIAEEQRLLYVAMTRAREKLIITGVARGAKRRIDSRRAWIEALGGEVGPALLREQTNYLDLLLMGYAAHPEDFVLRIADAHPEESREEEETADPEEVVGRETAPPLPGYLYEEETTLRPKVSVSDIKHMAIEALESGHPAAGPEEPAYAYTSGSEDGALRGTAFHRAMELLSFSLDEEAELLRLRSHPHFSEAERSILDWDGVRGFLHSDIAERMRKAAAQGLLHREQRFMAGFPAGDLIEGQHSHELQILQGIIDAYFEEDGGLVIVDYKTDRFVDEATLIDRYETQLRLYGRALAQLRGMQVKELVIYSTFLNREIEV